jgi:hypothetical protein
MLDGGFKTNPLLIDEPVELEKELVIVHDFRKSIGRFRRTYGIYFKVIKKNRTGNWH